MHTERWRTQKGLIFTVQEDQSMLNEQQEEIEIDNNDWIALV
ncbi:MAG: hypothetical protein RI894_1795 [Bacteroidota bacterium]|jgi:hypothetical protein